MLVAGLVSWKLELGQTKRIVVSSVRTFVQLLAAGFVLMYLFQYQTWWFVLLALGAMVLAATQIATSRVEELASRACGRPCSCRCSPRRWRWASWWWRA